MRLSTKHLKATLAVALVAAVSGSAAAQAGAGEEGTYLIRGGTVVNPGGQRLANTNILVRNNRIVQIGAGVTAAEAKVIDAAGKYIYPGMIDANTGIGLTEIGGIGTMNLRSEMGQYNPHMKALVALNVESELLGVTRMNGVTTVVTSPTGGVISGQAAMVNTAGWTWEDLSVVKSAGMVLNVPGIGGGGGMGGRGGPAPVLNTSAQVAELERFITASREYDARRKAGSTKLDLIYESMRPFINKEIPALIPASGEVAIKSAIEFGEKWGLRVVIIGGAQAWRVRTLLAQKNIPVILSSIQAAPNAVGSPYDEIYAQPGLLAEAGVKFAFSTGGGSNARHVPFHASLAVAYGLKADDALKALTIWPAEIFGAQLEIGSIEQGKQANFFITTGDPMDLRTQVVEVFIKGRMLADDDRHSRLYAKYKSRPLPIKP